MGCRTLHGVRASPSFGGPSDHLGSAWAGAPGGLWCLSGFVAGGVVNSTSNRLFVAPPAHEVGLALGFVGGFVVWFSLGGWEVSLDGVVVLRSSGVRRFMSMS